MCRTAAPLKETHSKSQKLSPCTLVKVIGVICDRMLAHRSLQSSQISSLRSEAKRRVLTKILEKPRLGIVWFDMMAILPFQALLSI